MPSLIVIGGPNGSGKTTLTTYLIQKGRIKIPVINPDEIAFNELGSYDFQFKAARVALDRRKEAITTNSDIAFETTFSGNTEIITRFKIINTAKAFNSNGFHQLHLSYRTKQIYPSGFNFSTLVTFS